MSRQMILADIPPLAQVWIKSMLTTKQPQGTQFLCSDTGFCCLGLLENLNHTVVSSYGESYRDGKRHEIIIYGGGVGIGESANLTDTTQTASGLSSSVGSPTNNAIGGDGKPLYSCSYMNDNLGFSFYDIALHLLNHLEAYFPNCIPTD